ncbi:hypothetical protein STENM223S_00869 [Streptomyces tendae]
MTPYIPLSPARPDLSRTFVIAASKSSQVQPCSGVTPARV